MYVFMRNRRTTEHRAVQLDGPEFLEMRAEVGPDNRPVWEQTSSADAEQQVQRVREGAPRDEDFGDAQQPRQVITGNAPDIEVRDRRIDPTDGELEMGITVEDKLAQVEEAEGQPLATDVPEGLEGEAGEPFGGGLQSGGSGGGDEELTVDELKEELRERGLPVSGTKQELVDRLNDADEDDEGETADQEGNKQPA